MSGTEHPARLAAATRAVALGRPERVAGAPVNVPVSFTSTYIADGEVNYARTSNPTWEALEEVLGSLEGGSALIFGSGLAAVSAVVSLVPIGGVVVAPQHVYNGTTGILGERTAAGALTVRTVPAEDIDAIVAACEGAVLLVDAGPTEFTGFNELTSEARILGIFVDGRRDRGRRGRGRRRRRGLRGATRDAAGARQAV